ncbi:MAG: DUF4942 domain-containing protein [Halomonas sp.]
MTTLSTATRGVSPPTSELDQLLEDRANAEGLLTRAINLIAEANALTPDPDGRDGQRQLKIGLAGELRNADWYSIDNPQRRPELVNKCLAHFDRDAWMLLLKRSRMAELMSHQDKEAYYKQLRDKPPALTRESVVGTFTELFGNRQATWRRSVVELFAGLAGRYKSHDPFKVGRRMILPNALGWAGWSFYTHADDKVDDLQRVIHVIQGKEPPTSEEQWSRLIDRARRDGAKGWQAGTLVEFRWFKNGSLHIWMQDDTITDAINEIIAEHYGAALAGRKA